MATYPKGNKFLTKFMVNGVRHTAMTDTEDEGKAWEMNSRANLLRGLPVLKPSPKTLGGGDAGTLKGVLRSAEKLHWNTLKDSSKTVLNATTFVNWAGPDVAPSDALTEEKVEEFVEYLIDERQVAGSTINRYLSAISTLIRFAGKKLTTKPDLSHLWKKESEGRLRWFSDEEEALVLQTWRLWSKEKERDFFTFLIDTGARPFSEAARLKWDDVGHRKVTFWNTKNGKARTLPLTTRAWEAVERARGNGLAGPFSGMKKDDTVRLWNRTRTHFEGMADTVLYTCRHTCASRLVQRGIDIVRVKDWMGHTTITTTMRYAHLAPRHLLDVVNALEPSGRPASEPVDQAA